MVASHTPAPIVGSMDTLPVLSAGLSDTQAHMQALERSRLLEQERRATERLLDERMAALTNPTGQSATDRAVSREPSVVNVVTEAPAQTALERIKARHAV